MTTRLENSSKLSPQNIKKAQEYFFTYYWALQVGLVPGPALRASLPASPSPAWIQEFNNLPETTRTSYIAQFRKAEQLFAQKRIMECLFSLMELESLTDADLWPVLTYAELLFL